MNYPNSKSCFGSRLDWEQREVNLEKIRLEQDNAGLKQSIQAIESAKVVEEAKKKPGRPKKEETLNA